MLRTGRLFQANGQPAQAKPDPKKSLARYLPAFLRKKPPKQPVMVVATIK